MKNDGLLWRNVLKRRVGDALHTVLCGACHNLRMILRKLRLCAHSGAMAYAIITDRRGNGEMNGCQCGLLGVVQGGLFIR
jgi:IS5 family transposase